MRVLIKHVSQPPTEREREGDIEKVCGTAHWSVCACVCVCLCACTIGAPSRAQCPSMRGLIPGSSVLCVAHTHTHEFQHNTYSLRRERERAREREREHT